MSNGPEWGGVAAGFDGDRDMRGFLSYLFGWQDLL